MGAHSSVEVSEFLWSHCLQLTAVVVLIGVLARLTSRRRPHLAYVLWLVVIAKCVVPPLLSSPTGIFSWVPTREVVSLPPRAEEPSAGGVAVQSVVTFLPPPRSTTGAAVDSEALSEHSALSVWVIVLVGAWVTGAVVLGGLPPLLADS